MYSSIVARDMESPLRSKLEQLIARSAGSAAGVWGLASARASLSRKRGLTEPKHATR
ncbi:hypothetical protein SPHINGO8AM_150034 [Sphingomonas sp. 8AM]|nr:hypothetical protein SPHINGO8AM_150034 [Sphingomonas sp. 8AM]